MIKLHVGPAQSRIEGLTHLPDIDALSAELSYFIPGYKYSPKYKYGNWDGRERLLTRTLGFPSGLVERVSDFLSRKGHEIDIEEHIDYPEEQEPLPWKGFELRPYQVDVVERALSAHRGMIKMATGGGKSATLTSIVGTYNVPTMVYVVSLDLLTQLHSTMEEFLGVEIGIIGGGQCEIKEINVCSVWTIGKACGEKVKNEEEDVSIDKWDPSDDQKKAILDAVSGAQCVILDEAQFAAASTVRVILKNSTSAAYKFGCSATPFRTNGDDLLLEAAFGSQICDISASELIDKGYLVPPKIVWRDIPEPPRPLPKKWAAVKSAYITNNDIRNDIIIENTKALLEMGRRPLVLFREIKHGKILKSMIPSNIRTRFVTGALSLDERDAIREEFLAGEVDLILASVVYDQGIDLPELDALVLAGGGKSTAKMLQRIGRVIRASPGKEDAIVVDMFDQARYVQGHSIIRYGICSKESKFVLKTEEAMTAALDFG